MKILVTGGAGYIGATLVQELLNAGQSVRVLDNLSYGGYALLPWWSHPQFEFMDGDIRDARTREKSTEGVDAIVHLAAIVGDPACARQPELATSVNLDASLALLDVSARREVPRFIFASTCSNYGRMANSEEYVDETSELRPLSLYAETKVAVERAMLEGPIPSHQTVTCLRFATVYGVAARMRFDLTVNEFTAELLTKRRLVVFGEQFWRPYIHVRDAAKGIALVLNAPVEKVRSQVFNVGSTEQNFRKQQLVELIHPYAPDAKVEYVFREDDPRDYRVSFERIKRELGFQITRTMPEGISEVARLVKSGLIQDFSNPIYRN